jgi:hypothetical protein
MAWRVIVRFSFNGDTGSIVRNAIAPLLNDCGLQNTRTGIWESPHVDQQQAAAKLGEVIKTIANPTAIPNAAADVAVDHLWVYLDNAD